MMVGLQGSGKTTSTGKLAKYLKANAAKNPLIVACDVYRLAAIDQVKKLGTDINVPVYDEGTEANPVEIAKNALEYAKENNHNLVIIDTAGRLEIDEQLMEELVDIKDAVNPDEVLLVVDALSGQNAVNVADKFNEYLGVTGAIFTKLDSDARGGAALSIKHLTGVSIKFAATGEKLDDFAVFHPDRMSQRILGMGDMLTLIEQAEAKIDEKEAEKLASKLKKGEIDLEMFLSSMKQMKRLGSLKGILKLIPGVSKMGLGNLDIDDKQLSHTEAIILSMTKEERKDPGIIKHSRKQRIVKGSGRPVQEINKLLDGFSNFAKNKDLYAMMMDDNADMSGMNPMDMMKNMGQNNSRVKPKKKRMKRVRR